ncbi:hypothetical protein [Sporichthya polymorpha]|uniref:hypothetical protein n=1 Tax=Sporichthya polymorpha TaxID=35751 RepID=UPI0012EB78FD|nr:hypothetical protein [Sporichthya polymorpha]
MTQKVPYSQTRWWTDSAGTFRQDCSGYVSMAWRTDQRINYWTGNLARVSDRISSPALRPGDVLNLAGKHVVIFAGWEDAAKTKFRLFEQYATGHTPRFVRNAPLSYYLSRGYGAYRYEGIVEPRLSGAVSAASLAATPSTPTAAAARSETFTLMAASSNLEAADEAPARSAEAVTPESLLVDLPATVWTPTVAEQYTADAAVADSLPSDTTPAAERAVSPEYLVAEQQALDAAAVDAAEAALAATNPTALATRSTSPAGLILAAGLGLLVLAVPLAAASRGRIWIPVVGAVAPLARHEGGRTGSA